MPLQIEEEDDSYGVPLTPLIDVVFLLLIFFATSTSFIDPEKDINIDLPEGSEGVTQPEVAQDIIVNVSRAGTIIVHGKVLDIDSLVKLLQEATADSADQAVIVRGDRHVYHRHVVAVLNACVKANVRNLSIAQVSKEEE